jgi:ribosomal peptide maturation radical SAM protein 1
MGRGPTQQTERLGRRVLLASMPFGHLIYASIGMSLLKAGLERQGIGCDLRYFALDFVAHAIGGPRERAYTDYHQFATLWEYYYPAEAIFSRHLFPKNADRAREALAQAPEGRMRTELERLWETSGAFLDHCLDTIPWQRYRLVGFSTMFNQNLATLALAERLKARHPDITIVLGGANTEGPHGPALLRSFPFVDYVLRGDADATLPALAEAVLDGRPPAGDLPGLVWRAADGAVVAAPSRPFAELDELSTPSYRDFFDQARALGFGEIKAFAADRRIPYEASRGCWWGERSHCTFCGLNGLAMTYRRKSPECVVEEIESLSAVYAPRKICCVDNILHPGFFNNVFPTLKERGIDAELSFEVKSNLKRRHMAAMRDAGISEIQPGIESLSTRVLGLMRKGATMLDNVRCLRLAEEYGIETIWLHLYDFPNESVADYRAVVADLPLIYHLPPPVEYDTRMTVRRFSPYFDDAERFGVRELMPAGAMRLLYALDARVVFDLAYRFDAVVEDGRSADDRWLIATMLQEGLARWRARYRDGSDLALYAGERSAIILDLRGGQTIGYGVGPFALAVLRAADDILEPGQRAQLVATLMRTDRANGGEADSGDTGDRLVARSDVALRGRGLALRRLRADCALPLDPITAEAALRRLVRELDRAGLVLVEDDRMLSLPLVRPPALLADIIARQAP